MRDVVFAMALRGRAAPVEGSPNTLTARTGGRGPHGETVAFESRGRLILLGMTCSEKISFLRCSANYSHACTPNSRFSL